MYNGDIEILIAIRKETKTLEATVNGELKFSVGMFDEKGLDQLNDIMDGLEDIPWVKEIIEAQKALD